MFTFGVAACDDGEDPTDATDAGTDAANDCDTFCADFATTCPDVTFDSCATDCAGWTAGASGDTSGNTYECRVYHLGAAGDDAATHCPHAVADGGGVCVD
jgi:hypothetical protein